MRALNVLLALLVSALIGVLVLEAGLRLLGLGPPRNLLRFDPVAGWSKKPDAVQHKRTSEYEVAIATNALGLRDDPMSAPGKPQGTFRVLALGDSFTQGWSVERADLFVDILERWWQAEGRAVDVINGGTEGWSTDQEVAWFLDQGARFQPDLVLIFPYENDLFWCAETQYTPNRDKPRFSPEGELEPRELVDRAGSTWTDDFAITRALLRPRPEPGRFNFVPSGGSQRVLKEFGALLVERPEFMAQAEARALGALKALKWRCAEVGARAIVVPIPSHSAVDPAYARGFGEQALHLPAERWSPDLPVDTFLRLAAAAGLEALDPRASLRAAAGPEPIYFDQDWHFNPAGNGAFARFVKQELDQRQVFPEGFRARTRLDQPLAVARPRSSGVPFALKLYLGLWAALSILYLAHYRDEPTWQPPLKVGALLAVVFGTFLGARALIGLVPPEYARLSFAGLAGVVLLFVAWKLGRRIGTIAELMASFTLRGHWYLMPLIVVLLTVGSLLVVAASSPLVAPFIYTLF